MRLLKGQSGEGMQDRNGELLSWIHSVLGPVWSLTEEDTTHQEPAKQIYFKGQDTQEALIKIRKINVSYMNCQTAKFERWTFKQ